MIYASITYDASPVGMGTFVGDPGTSMNTPLAIQAIAQNGSTFSHWEATPADESVFDDANAASTNFTPVYAQPYTLTAVFTGGTVQSNFSLYGAERNPTLVLEDITFELIKGVIKTDREKAFMICSLVRGMIVTGPEAWLQFDAVKAAARTILGASISYSGGLLPGRSNILSIQFSEASNGSVNLNNAFDIDSMQLAGFTN
jgi:hypothetical protein